ncbi:MAG TPA: hypothetical protein VF796_31030, partial [Humisphaera sp.]
AEARARKALADAGAVGRTLAAREGSLPPGSGLKGKLSPLGALPADDTRGGWVPEARKRLDAAAAGIARYQDQSDQRLYDTNEVVRGRCDALAARTRFELAAELLVRPGGLLSKLDPQTQVLVFGFADVVSPLGRVEPAPASATQPSAPAADAQSAESFFGPAAPAVVWTGDRLPLKPDGAGTEITAALAAALTAAEGRPVRGVVVISDGQQVGAESAKAAAVVPPGVPVIAINAAGPTAPRDLAVADVSFPPAAFVGENLLVRARLRSTGGAPLDPTSAVLTAPGELGDAEVPATPIDKPAADKAPARKDVADALVQFAVKFERPGVHEVTVDLPAVAGEVSADNNATRRWVKVLPERVRVAAFAGSPAWDFQHLRGALSRRDWFDLEAGVLGAADPELPLTPQQIARLDVLVLYDVPERALSPQQWLAAEQMVARRGGSVVVVAGPTFDPAAWGRNPLAASLLPFDFAQDPKPEWRPAKGDRGAKLVPGPEFARSDVLRLDDADAYNRRWADLPGVTRVLPVQRPRPGARALLRDEQHAQAVATELPREAGRAFYVGTADTWRWRARGAEAEHERFWRQLVRHAAEDPYAARAGRLLLDVDRVAVSAGEPVHVRAKILPPEDPQSGSGTGSGASTTRPLAPEPPPAETLSVVVVDAASRDGRVVRTLKLTEAATGGGRLRGTLPDLPPGEYVVRLSSPAAAAGTPLPEVRLRVEGLAEAEVRNLAGDPDRLRQMAETTGGRLLRPDQFAAVQGLLATAADDRPRVAEWSLWDSPWLFAFVVACLGAEWAMRKRAGLA